jgi:hypothetical protein
MSESDEIELSPREMAIARKAADLAVEKMQNDFYAHVGKSVIKRGVILLGAIAVGVAAGKGWINVGGVK